MKVGDFVVERLHAWGVRRIYGYPGDGINGVIGALQRAGDIEFIQVRHEEMAAFMAVAHAKFTGELGVCLSTGGPGATLARGRNLGRHFGVSALMCRMYSVFSNSSVTSIRHSRSGVKLPSMPCSTWPAVTVASRQAAYLSGNSSPSWSSSARS